jgi:hypothetical protein
MKSRFVVGSLTGLALLVSPHIASAQIAGSPGLPTATDIGTASGGGGGGPTGAGAPTGGGGGFASQFGTNFAANGSSNLLTGGTVGSTDARSDYRKRRREVEDKGDSTSPH